MKIQHLAIIFIIIIVPISLVLGEYIQTQIDTIYVQSDYNKKLQDACYDAMKAFQINTINNKYSSLNDSKIRDIEASITAFYNSLSASMGSSGYNENSLKEYIPAMVYTMYDGYYIYGKYYDYNISGGTPDYNIGLKPYISYSCRYVDEDNNHDFIINYTLDNSISIYGYVNGDYITRSGYVVDPEKVNNGRTINVTAYNGENKDIQYINYGDADNFVLITDEILSEEVLIIDDSNGNSEINSYEYVKYNNQKIYMELVNNEPQYFTCLNNRRTDVKSPADSGEIVADDEMTPYKYVTSMTWHGEDGQWHLHSDSAINYYREAREFSSWLQLSLGTITQDNAVEINNLGEPTQIQFEISVNNPAGNSANIFEFGDNNDPLTSASYFNEHRMNVIRHSIQTNLATALASYNSGSSTSYEYTIPKIGEEDWDKILNNVSLSVFMQGLPMKSKYYNSYCVVANKNNEEVVTSNSIYVIETKQDGTTEAHMPNCKDLMGSDTNINVAYNNIDFIRQTGAITEGVERYFYPHPYQRCYSCIVNTAGLYRIDDIILGNLQEYNRQADVEVIEDAYENVSLDSTPNFTKVRKAYLTALARERYDLYRVNKEF